MEAFDCTVFKAIHIILVRFNGKQISWNSSGVARTEDMKCNVPVSGIQ